MEFHPKLEDAFQRYENAQANLEKVAAAIIRSELVRWSKSHPTKRVEYCNEMGSCTVTVKLRNGSEWVTFGLHVSGFDGKTPHPLRSLIDAIDDRAGLITRFNSLVVGTIAALAGEILEDSTAD